jgi:hypothetical protein
MLDWEEERNPFANLSFAELMDRAFELWCTMPGGITFEEYLAGGESENGE